MTDEKKNDLKDTLFIPDTPFEMKANLSQKEAQFSLFWENINLYKKVLDKNKKKESFFLHDGPPYANGSLHVGHAMNKILKDIIIRYKNMTNFYAPFILGWDTHGLPIENKILEINKVNHNEMDKNFLREKSFNYALEQVDFQINQFKKMNLLTNFNEKYLTLDKNFEANELEIFKKMYFDNLIYRGLKPVFWSPTSQSALAEAEIEYEEISSPQIFIACQSLEWKNTFFVVMTTTPWTLIANSAIAIGVEFKYVFAKVKDKTYIIAKKMLEELSKLFKWEKFEIVKEVIGRELLNQIYLNPLNQKQYHIVSGEHVEENSGSGLVHIAPLFGEEDFIVGKKNNLEMIMHINDDGTLNELSGEFKNIFYLNANKLIGNKLDENDNLLNLKFIKHSYPHDWRSKKPVIFRGTPQWFVSVEKIKNNILEKLENVTSYPEWGISRLKQMIANRSDWTISRQRTWGVPIIIFYDKNKKELKDEKVFDYVINLIRQKGTDVWFKSSPDELLPEKYRNQGYEKETDILDVWFDSGTSFINFIKDNKLPFDLYLEGSDQYRGWFNSSAITSIAYKNILPFKKIISHGFVLDGNLQKMSKSKGNIIDPEEIISKYGSDILRLWVANIDYTSDVSISNEILKQVVEMYRNIRTKLRFLLGNLKNWDESKDRIKKLNGYNAVIFEKLSNLKYDVKDFFDNYKFSSAIKEINNFITEISGFYLDYTKDVLYADNKNDSRRNEVLTNIYDIAFFIIKIFAPILVTTMEEAYKFFPKIKKEESVHLENIDFNNASNSKIEQEKFKSFFLIKDLIYREIDKLKKDGLIKRSQEIKFNLNPLDYEKICKENKIDSNLSIFENNINDMLMIGKFSFDSDEKTGIQKWANNKCLRCWKHFDEDELIENLCLRCINVLNN